MSSAIENPPVHAPSRGATSPALPACVEDGPAPLAALVDKARAYARASRAPSTLAAYRRHVAVFGAWCRRHGRYPLPALPDEQDLAF